MSFPALVKYAAADMLLNQSITFVSLLATTGGYATGITNQAIAKGYTCAGSSNGVAAAMDGTNRCTLAAGFAVQGANSTTPQSWIVITAANGAQTLLAYQGASNDIFRVSCSPGGLFVVAATATHQPTATDEVVASASNSLIGATASGNRVYNVWIDSAHNGWRAAVFRSNVLVGSLIGVELFDPAYILSPAICAVPTWAFGVGSGNPGLPGNLLGTYTANTCGGSTRMSISGTPTTINMGASAKILGLQATAESGVIQELNGSSYLLRSIGLYSNTATGRGDVGNRYDWWFDSEMKACGELDAAKNWLYINDTTSAGSKPGLLWPWDGASAWAGS